MKSPSLKWLLPLAIFGCVHAAVAQSTDAQQAVPISIATSPAIQPAPAPPLVRARNLVERFFDQSSNVVCDESITQSTVGKNDKPNYREESRFQYQLEASNASGSLKLKESRDARKIAFRDANRTLLITNGFTSMLLIVHPDYETSYQFESAGEEVIDGHTLDQIRFKPIPGGKSPAAMQLRG